MNADVPREHGTDDTANLLRLRRPLAFGSWSLSDNDVIPTTPGGHHLDVCRRSGLDLEPVGTIALDVQPGVAGTRQLDLDILVALELTDADADQLVETVVRAGRTIRGQFEIEPRVIAWATSNESVAEALERRIDVFRWTGVFADEADGVSPGSSIADELDGIRDLIELASDDPATLRDVIADYARMLGSTAAALLRLDPTRSADELLAGLDEAAAEPSTLTAEGTWIFGSVSHADLQDLVDRWADEHIVEYDDRDAVRSEAERLLREVFDGA